MALLRVVTLLFHLLLLVSFSSSSSSPSKISLPSLSSDSEKVSLSFYYESLCPYCSNFLVNHLVKLFEDDLISIVDLRLVPWGNTKVREDNTIVCQHGPYECLLDRVEACAIDSLPELSDHFPFIYCVEKLVYEGKYKDWETCFEKLSLDPIPITQCYGSEHGKKLEMQYAAETNALEPPHTYVPWVVVNGQPLYEDYENFISYICSAYKGESVPKACSGVTRNTIRTVRSKLIHPVCPKETMIGTFLTRVTSKVMLLVSNLNLEATSASM